MGIQMKTICIFLVINHNITGLKPPLAELGRGPGVCGSPPPASLSAQEPLFSPKAMGLLPHHTYLRENIWINRILYSLQVRV